MNKAEFARLTYLKPDGTSGLTQEELAEKARIKSVQIIKDLEENKPVKIHHKVMIAAALDLIIPAYRLQDPLEKPQIRKSSTTKGT